jgi:kynureninase
MAGPQTQGFQVTNFEASRKFAQSLDAADGLRQFRDYFNFPVDKDGRRNIYLCGNSLGLQSKLAVQYIEEELKKWADSCVDGHFSGLRPWVQYHRESTRRQGKRSRRDEFPDGQPASNDDDVLSA